MRTYREALDYLYYQLPMYQRQGPKAFKKDLTNIRTLCAQLDHPEQGFTAIHVAGTNGKGSTSHYIAAILQAAGYTVGLYTSPHYKDFRERIKINGAFIPKKKVVEFVSWIQEHVEIQPSFFEITVAMAFHHFRASEVDVAVIETGLGGRLDSTNVVSPILSVITNISLDHTNFLGDTLPAIAGEKAGIIKANVPVLIGRRQESCKEVFVSKAAETRSELFWAEDLYKSDSAVGELSGRDADASFSYAAPRDTFMPAYAYENMRTAIAAVDLLNRQSQFSISQQHVQAGLRNVHQLTYFIGRWMTLQERPTIIAESAHNKDGMTEAMKALDTYSYDKLHVVLGFVFDKDIGPVLNYFPKEATYYFAKAAIPRGLAADALQMKAREYGLHGKAYTSVRRALAAAKRRAGEQDLIYVGGSIFTVAEVL